MLRNYNIYHDVLVRRDGEDSQGLITPQLGRIRHLIGASRSVALTMSGARNGAAKRQRADAQRARQANRRMTGMPLWEAFRENS